MLVTFFGRYVLDRYQKVLTLRVVVLLPQNTFYRYVINTC